MQVEQIQSEHLWPLQVGVIWVDPDTIELMPRCGEYLPRSVIITPHSICYSAKEVQSFIKKCILKKKNSSYLFPDTGK